MNDNLKQKLKSLPITPGVYLHKNSSGEVIYVGKAAVLKNRVRQYFQSKKDFDVKTLALVNEIADTDWFETESEVDALFLESEMVKRYMPRYNILLRDDKSQMFVRIDFKSVWPTVSFTRNPADDGATYYGPYYNGYAIKKALRYLRRVFPYYTKPPTIPRRPDLDTHLGLSPSLSVGSVEYKRGLKKLARYIKGERIALLSEIEKEMLQAANKHQFELAATHRNRLNNLKELQRKIMFGDREFMDISKDRALSDLVRLFGLDAPPARIEGYDISHMSGTNVVASMVVFTNGVSDRAEYRKFKLTQQRNNDTENITEIITRRFDSKNVKAWGIPELILVDGGKGQLMAAAGAVKQSGFAVPVIGLAKRNEEIVLSKFESNIDVSHVENIAINPPDGVSVTVGDDYYVLNLHVGQLNASGHSRNLRASNGTYEYTDITKLFQRIRDESHRFAISYHEKLRQKGQVKSVLEDIPGVGPATRRKLLRKFGSVRGIIQAGETEIAAEVGPVLARNIVANLVNTNT